MGRLFRYALKRGEVLIESKVYCWQVTAHTSVAWLWRVGPQYKRGQGSTAFNSFQLKMIRRVEGATTMGFVFLLAGIAAILTGIFGRTLFAADALTLSGYKHQRKVSTWWGKSIFIVVGLFFIALGVKFLLDGTSW